MKNDFIKVNLLAIGNLALAGMGNLAIVVGNFLDKATQILHVSLMLGQVGVASITIVYIWKKIKVVGTRKPPE